MVNDFYDQSRARRWLYFIKRLVFLFNTFQTWFAVHSFPDLVLIPSALSLPLLDSSVTSHKIGAFSTSVVECWQFRRLIGTDSPPKVNHCNALFRSRGVLKGYLSSKEVIKKIIGMMRISKPIKIKIKIRKSSSSHLTVFDDLLFFSMPEVSTDFRYFTIPVANS